MKNVITILIMSLFTTTMLAQAPQKMSYQAVVRNASNTLVSNANVGMRISVLQGTANGTPVYVETQTSMTNDNGLVTLEIGGGAVVSGTFASISWGTNTYFIKTETDPAGGTNYTIVGTAQFLSVPYALFAASGNPGPQGPQGVQGLPGTMSNTYVNSSSINDSSQVIRNQWIDYPFVTVTVPQNGKYMMSFFGGAGGGPGYFLDAGSDFDCFLRIVNANTGIEIANTQMKATHVLHFDENGATSHYNYLNMQPSRTIILDLTANQLLKIQYNQNSSSTTTSPWYMYGSGITIVKIAD